MITYSQSPKKTLDKLYRPLEFDDGENKQLAKWIEKRHSPAGRIKGWLKETSGVESRTINYKQLLKREKHYDKTKTYCNFVWQDFKTWLHFYANHFIFEVTYELVNELVYKFAPKVKEAFGYLYHQEVTAVFVLNRFRRLNRPEGLRLFQKKVKRKKYFYRVFQRFGIQQSSKHESAKQHILKTTYTYKEKRIALEVIKKIEPIVPLAPILAVIGLYMATGNGIPPIAREIGCSTTTPYNTLKKYPHLFRCLPIAFGGL